MICIFIYFPTHLSFFLLNNSMSEIWFFLFLINFVNQISIYSKIHQSSYFLVNTILETTLKKRKNVLQSLYFPKVYSHAGLYTQIYSLFKSKMKIHVFRYADERKVLDMPTRRRYISVSRHSHEEESRRGRSCCGMVRFWYNYCIYVWSVNAFQNPVLCGCWWVTDGRGLGNTPLRLSPQS